MDEIHGGGPSKDGIPALLEPKLVPAGEAGFLRPQDRVVGVVRDGVAKAYPLRVLNWHEVVNDRIGSTALAVTYCPLTASAVVFDRAVGERTLSFGVSGRLYQSNVLLYDHQTESLWSQLGGEAITGPQVKSPLRALPAITTTWAAWRREHPDTLVLSDHTGFRRDYGRDPYAAYHTSPRLMFPVRTADARLPDKTKVFGLEIGDEAVAYPLASLATAGKVADRIAGVAVRIEYDRKSATVRATDAETGRPRAGVVVYWFAWSAFHIQTRLWAEAPTAAPAPRRSAPKAPTGSAEGSGRVEVTAHLAYWTDLPGVGAGDLEGDPDVLLVITGSLRNGSDRPLHHVKLAYELLDDKGRVVASEEGYNRGGEALKPVDDPEGRAAAGTGAARPIPAGKKEPFRMFFVRSELPVFARYRIRVVGAPAVD